ncbi:DnaJ domain-containing protein [Halobellus salinisoli]|uniref:DnaJ domain-containing protein n=1 Tax=Halobellus salinisoli TaxID=3108500 RepID=UPI003009D1B1
MEDFYDLLEVSRDASTEEINRAWRRKVRRYHPDVNDDARAGAQFKTLKKAHEVLSEESERAAYDRMGHVAYVDQRLDGLPTKPSRTSEAETPSEGETPTETTASTETTQSTETGSRTRTDEQRHREGQSATSRADHTRQTKTSQRFGHGTHRTRQTNAEGAGSNRTSSTATNAARSHSEGTADQSGASTTSASATMTQPQRRASPLLYGWLGVLLAGTLYLAGLWQYLSANAAALATLRRTARTDPAAALTGTFDLIGPSGFALAATLDAPRSLLFPVGVVALAVVLTAVVLSFGRGLAYLYALGGFVPLVALGVDTVLSLPDGVVLLLVALCPLGATVGFLVDVGRVALVRRAPRS